MTPTDLTILGTAGPLTTERLELLPVEVGFAEEMAQVLGDRVLHTFIGGEPEDADALRTRYARWAKGSPDPALIWLNRVVRLREGAHLVGTVQATVWTQAPQTEEASAVVVAEVAWVVGTAWQGRGLAKEAARAWVTWLRARGVAEVRAHIHPDNLASAAVGHAVGLAPTDIRQDGEQRWSAHL
ncbi:GNAT family N-acetyltransferase [Streptomyces sp. SID3343]|uniref:GNAT family N-acetyltransferase n=1 Tax=Streptomyces sp. SID3343 TaxID=2690260 RepID=UPI00192780A6|nr:GNAT family N-acetyltransferase [Streptomyces sp. SID3343]